MSCTNPMYRIPVGSHNYSLLNEHDKRRAKNDGVFFYDLSAIKFLQDSLPTFQPEDVQIIPCGHCFNCCLSYSRDWAIRCSLEAQRHEHNYFVTLTYDDFSLPSGEFVDYHGEVWDSNLCRRDVQLFLKSLREWERIENSNTGIKVFYCGEYGGDTGRPHYHLCLFGVSEIPDLKFSFQRGDYKYYKSGIYESFWSTKVSGVKVLRGFVDISEVSFDTIAYTARYVTKKQRGFVKKEFLEFYDSLDEVDGLKIPLRTQPFIGMSLKPGIASEYWNENKGQIKLEDQVKYQKRYDLFKAKPPRYFDKLFDREDPGEFAKVKERRKSTGYLSKVLKDRLVFESEQGRLIREARMSDDKQKRYSRSL